MTEQGQTELGAAVAAPESASPQPTDRAPLYPDLNGLEVFLVEDETLVALLLEDMLSDFGCSIAGVAGSLDQAMTKAATTKIDAAVLDVNLGGGTMVFPLADELAKRGVPFVFSTAYAGLDLTGRYPQSKMLQKPYAPEALAEVLTGFLELER